ncbi:MAG: tRNA 2-thiouridine(34) synthase MnmA [Bacillota bacterium]
MKTKEKKKLKILVAMSGGVDSSVAAQLLKNRGYDVSGVFLHFWKDDKAPVKTENKCCSLESLNDAKAVAAKIGIPLFSLNFEREFKKEVVDYFLAEYGAGRTPNPCVVCNKRIKLGLLLKHARALGYDGVASGHYLKRLDKEGEALVYKGNDPKKDQSYFLYTFSQAELRHLYFPLGRYRKEEVRKIAARFGLPTASKAESQDICFLSGPHNDFLKRYLKLIPGPIRCKEDGKEIGRHEGLPLYTLGQRRGIEIGGSGPYYVAEKDYSANTLWVVRQWDDHELYGMDFSVSGVSWTGRKIPVMPLRCEVVIRYGYKPIRCLVSGRGKKLRVSLKEQTRAITSGQSAVFFSGSRLLGGGVID